MRTIREMAKPLPGLLGRQRLTPGEPYRLLHFVVQQPVDEGLLLYNVLTKAVVVLDPAEARQLTADPASVPGLVEAWFVVPQSHDDRRLAQEVRAVARMLQPPVRGIKTYTIFTTTDCNARCFYCFQKGRSQIPMRDETAVATADYIVRHAAGQKVRLCWFGGEPLYNKGVITRICTLLEEAGVPYKSTMVSNGFLFDAPTIAEAVSLWHLKQVQITLDGTEPVYNRVKHYLEPGESPFRRVLDNIRGLSEAGVNVRIRLNIDRYNAEDLFALADQLGAAFGADRRVTVYTHTLFEDCMGGAGVHHSDDERRALYEQQMRLRERLRALGLARPVRFDPAIHLNNCISDNDACVTVLPDGRLGKCEHYTESGTFGHVSEPGQDESVIAAFKALRPELDACGTCPVYPDCFRLVKCDVVTNCYPEDRAEKLQTALRQSLSAYQHEGIQD